MSSVIAHQETKRDELIYTTRGVVGFNMHLSLAWLLDSLKRILIV